MDEVVLREGLGTTQQQGEWSHDDDNHDSINNHNHIDPSQALAVFFLNSIKAPNLPLGRPRRPLDRLKWTTVVTIGCEAAVVATTTKTTTVLESRRDDFIQDQEVARQQR
jgi:hypothetical protein